MRRPFFWCCDTALTRTDEDRCGGCRVWTNIMRCTVHKLIIFVAIQTLWGEKVARCFDQTARPTNVLLCYTRAYPWKRIHMSDFGDFKIQCWQVKFDWFGWKRFSIAQHVNFGTDYSSGACNANSVSDTAKTGGKQILFRKDIRLHFHALVVVIHQMMFK